VASKIHSDLPALREGHPLAGNQAANLAPAQQVAELMRAFGEGAHQRANDGVQDREPKQVQDVYRETYLLLLRHNRVEHTEDLAPIWRRLANSAKSEQADCNAPGASESLRCTGPCPRALLASSVNRYQADDNRILVCWHRHKRACRRMQPIPSYLQ
jgi:hypothetical protein